VSTLAGGAAGWTDAQGTAAKFASPWAVTVDPTTLSIIVGDMANQRVRRVSPAGLVSTLAGSGVAGSADGPALAATLSAPTACAFFPPRAALYFCDSGSNRVRVLAGGAVATLAGHSGAAGGGDGAGALATFSTPWGVAPSADGSTLYVTERAGNRLRAIALLPAPRVTATAPKTPILPLVPYVCSDARQRPIVAG
jgi:sugar lactone lactonase YvrE